MTWRLLRYMNAPRGREVQQVCVNPRRLLKVDVSGRPKDNTPLSHIVRTARYVLLSLRGLGAARRGRDGFTPSPRVS